MGFRGRGIGLLLLLAVPGAAHAGVAQDVAARLYAADLPGAAARAEAALAADPADATARLALGTARFLGATEGLLRSLHRYGLQTEYLGPDSMAGLPYLRLPVPANPTPEPVSYEALRDALERFGTGLAAAEETLAAVDGPVELPLDLMKVRLDATDGPGGEVTLYDLFLRVAGPVTLRGDIESPLLFHFDSADAAWLRAYCHLLMAMTDFVLAHDWEAAYAATFHDLFPRSFMPKTPLGAAAQTATRLEALSPPPQPDCDPSAEACMKLWQRWWADPAVQRAQALRNALQWGGIADMIAFVHLTRWPVVEPERMRRALGHLEAMVAGSRETWSRALGETDDEREWLPAPAQTGLLPLRIDADRLAGWMAFLDELEAILKGRKLVPHWRFAQGVNLRRMFLEPRPFDAVLLAQGSAALPYLEDGPISDTATWMRIMSVFGGDFFSYFVWIN